MAWALEQQTENPVDKLILIALGNYADENDQCFPSRRTLARIAMCSLDTVDRSIKRLEAAGHIRKESRIGARGLTSNAYTIETDPSRKLRLPADTNSDETLAATVRPPQPQIAATLAAHDAATLAAQGAATYEPSLEPSLEPSNPPSPKGGADDGKPVEDFSKVFARPDHSGVIFAAGVLTLVNGTRALWLEQFGNDAQALELALLEIAPEVQLASRVPVPAQVQRRLAGMARERRDRDRRYATAAAKRPSAAAAAPRKRSVMDVIRENPLPEVTQ